MVFLILTWGNRGKYEPLETLEKLNILVISVSLEMLGKLVILGVLLLSLAIRNILYFNNLGNDCNTSNTRSTSNISFYFASNNITNHYNTSNISFYFAFNNITNHFNICNISFIKFFPFPFLLFLFLSYFFFPSLLL